MTILRSLNKISTIYLTISLQILIIQNTYTQTSKPQNNGILSSLVLPTKNNYIFSNPKKFYMYTDRTFEGRKSRPWSGGKYGFSRNEKRTKYGVIFTKFHEGIDIKPLTRDKNGIPLDEVYAITDGIIVYSNDNPRHSSYGKYIVIKHDWGEGKFYSLYAHLAKTYIQVNQKVKTGQKIARLGYTGAGINKRRAHLHFEMNLMINNRFNKWHSSHYISPNYHGVYNGINLIGIDIVAMYKMFKDHNKFSIRSLIPKMTPYYKILIPSKIKKYNNNIKVPIIKNYPWLHKGGSEKIKSWEITFSKSGIPLYAKSTSTQITYPKITWVANSRVSHLYNTRSRVSGIGTSAKLSNSGSRYAQLISDRF